MARYFFDTDTGDHLVTDDEGQELDGIESVRIQAQAGLADMARDVVPEDGPERTITVRVRDEGGRVILRAALSLRVEVDP